MQSFERRSLSGRIERAGHTNSAHCTKKTVPAEEKALVKVSRYLCWYSDWIFAFDFDRGTHLFRLEEILIDGTVCTHHPTW